MGLGDQTNRFQHGEETVLADEEVTPADGEGVDGVTFTEEFDARGFSDYTVMLFSTVDDAVDVFIQIANEYPGQDFVQISKITVDASDDEQKASTGNIDFPIGSLRTKIWMGNATGGRVRLAVLAAK